MGRAILLIAAIGVGMGIGVASTGADPSDIVANLSRPFSCGPMGSDVIHLLCRAGLRF